MDTLETFSQRILSFTRLDPSQQPQKLAEILCLDPAKNSFVVTINSVGNVAESQVELVIERRRCFGEDWPAFDKMVISFVCLCNWINPWSILESFDLYTNYLNDISVAFTHKSKGYIVTKLLEETLRIILPMAKQLDQLMSVNELHSKPRLNFIASVLLRIFNNIRSQIGSGDHIEAAKRSIMLLIGAKLCQTYFLLSNPLRCQDVFANMNNADMNLTKYPPSQQLEYRYYLAKFCVAKYELVDAFVHLEWCIARLPQNYCKDVPNVSLLLRDFLPISILLGRRPNFSKFASKFYSLPSKVPQFFKIYEELGNAVWAGNFYGLHTLLNNDETSEVLRRHGHSSIFSSFAYLITLRNLFKSIWKTQGRNMRLGYDSVMRGLAVSLNGLDLTSVTSAGVSPRQKDQTSQSFDDRAIENCLVTLVDQNLLRGKLFPRLRVVSLAKTDVFPDITKTYFLKFGQTTSE